MGKDNKNPFRALNPFAAPSRPVISAPRINSPAAIEVGLEPGAAQHADPTSPPPIRSHHVSLIAGVPTAALTTAALSPALHDVSPLDPDYDSPNLSPTSPPPFAAARPDQDEYGRRLYPPPTGLGDIETLRDSQYSSDGSRPVSEQFETEEEGVYRVTAEEEAQFAALQGIDLPSATLATAGSSPTGWSSDGNGAQTPAHVSIVERYAHNSVANTPAATPAHASIIDRYAHTSGVPSIPTINVQVNVMNNVNSASEHSFAPQPPSADMMHGAASSAEYAGHSYQHGGTRKAEAASDETSLPAPSHFQSEWHSPHATRAHETEVDPELDTEREPAWTANNNSTASFSIYPGFGSRCTSETHLPDGEAGVSPSHSHTAAIEGQARRAPPPALSLVASNSSTSNSVSQHAEPVRIPLGYTPRPRFDNQRVALRRREPRDDQRGGSDPLPSAALSTGITSASEASFGHRGAGDGHSYPPRRKAWSVLGVRFTDEPTAAVPDSAAMQDVALTPVTEASGSGSRVANSVRSKISQMSLLNQANSNSISNSDKASHTKPSVIGILKSGVSAVRLPGQNRAVRVASPRTAEFDADVSSDLKPKSPGKIGKYERDLGVYRRPGDNDKWKKLRDIQHKYFNATWIIAIVVVILLIVSLVVPFTARHKSNDQASATDGTSTGDDGGSTGHFETPSNAARCASLFKSNVGVRYPCDACVPLLQGQQNDFKGNGNATGVGAALQYCALRDILRASDITVLVAGGWGTGDVCSWAGVTCDARRRVTGLNFEYPGAPAVLNSTLSNLVSLERLRIVGDGAFPRGSAAPLSSLARLANFTALDVEYTKLQGKLGNMSTSLVNLTLLANPSLSMDRASLKLAPLQTLVMSQQNLTLQTVPDIPNTVTYLDLSYNAISGRLDTYVLPKIKTLYLQSNNLTTFASGRLPRTLTALSLQGNPALAGVVYPDTCGGLTACDLRGTRLTTDCSVCFTDL